MCVSIVVCSILNLIEIDTSNMFGMTLIRYRIALAAVGCGCPSARKRHAVAPSSQCNTISWAVLATSGHCRPCAQWYIINHYLQLKRQ